ncbi:uncharacterized protein KY384_002530 [Bacidia gigantensis]|uniref:uncharacterized protein n=1 Tax=Bacidia gigantensis TaxID=2732470 RepID=UPI001D0546DB|nr:uncharacterized protein KY384_002530 [Bacidia gigantensis]KAG8532653.1 hypothetical protein KY384_002530 [Bacidia gigantensis]
MAKHLLEAPKIVLGVSTMTWMAFLEPPRDGTLMLVWQSPRVNQFASDGYLWADDERAFSQPMKGYTMEMYVRQRGFRLRFEPSTMHARRRFRLVPSPEPGQPSPQVDPSLWLIHYYRQPDLEHQIPASSVRPSIHDQQLMQERNMLQQQGQLLQLQHKEFMLRDRENWPTINMPGNSAQSYPQQGMGYPGNVMAHMNRSQQSAYMQNPPASMASGSTGPVAKRPRHGSVNQAHISSTAIPMRSAGQDATPDDEDSLVGVDYMDLLTPREISSQRYKQHHQWLEEVLSSPFDTNQIIPGELGLGRKGELESLTKDFFNAHTEANTGEERGTPEGLVTTEMYRNREMFAEETPAARVGQLEDGKFDDFRKRAAQRVEDLRSEMEQLRLRHSRRMEKLARGRSWGDMDLKLKDATPDLLNGSGLKMNAADAIAIDSTTEVAESKTKKKIRLIKPVECTDKGGLEEGIQKNVTKEVDVEMNGTPTDTNGLQEREISESQSESQSQSQASALSPSAAVNSTEHQASELSVKTSEVSPAPESQAFTEAKDPSPEDWIMIDKEADETEKDDRKIAFDSFTNNDTLEARVRPEETPQVSGDVGTVDEDLTFEDNDFASGIDFGDLDAAGDMMSYAQEIETMVPKNQDDINLGDQTSFQDNPGPVASSVAEEANGDIS